MLMLCKVMLGIAMGIAAFAIFWKSEVACEAYAVRSDGKMVPWREDD